MRLPIDDHIWKHRVATLGASLYWRHSTEAFYLAYHFQDQEGDGAGWVADEDPSNRSRSDGI